MALVEFIALTQNFRELSEPDKILHLGWFLHVHRKRERFEVDAVRQCFNEVHMEVPRNLARDMSRLAERKALLKDAAGYRLHHDQRRVLDDKYGEKPAIALIPQLLKHLPGKISDEGERLFLSEALKCYHAKAFRAAIVMAWNLAYDHLLNWILKEPARLAAFNTKIAGKVGAKRAWIVITKREDFEYLKESEVLDICGTAGLFASDNTKRVLGIQLTKRNLAAHPSLLDIGQPQADDAVYDLVNNVVLALT
jgi:hypothetical protein